MWPDLPYPTWVEWAEFWSAASVTVLLGVVVYTCGVAAMGKLLKRRREQFENYEEDHH